jgi:hypothetical protein
MTLFATWMRKDHRLYNSTLDRTAGSHSLAAAVQRRHSATCGETKEAW